MRGGHNKLPSNVHNMRGTARRDRMNPDEPFPPIVADPSPPDWLDPMAKRHWRKVIRVLTWLTEADLDRLALYCQAYAHYREVNKLMGILDFDSKEFEGWQPKDISRVLSSLPRQRKEAELSMRTLGADLGMDPVSRSRIHHKKPADGDQFDAWERVSS